MISTRNDDNLRPFTDSYGPNLAGVHFCPRRAKKVSDLKTRQSIKCMILILYGLPHQLWNNYTNHTLMHTSQIYACTSVYYTCTYTHTHTHTHTHTYIFTLTPTPTHAHARAHSHTHSLLIIHIRTLSLYTLCSGSQGNSAHSKQSVWKRVETTGNPFHGMILTAPTRARRARTSLM